MFNPNGCFAAAYCANQPENSLFRFILVPLLGCCRMSEPSRRLALSLYVDLMFETTVWLLLAVPSEYDKASALFSYSPAWLLPHTNRQ
jgi:hypothetical protein